MNHNMKPQEAANLSTDEWKVWVATKLVILEQNLQHHLKGHDKVDKWIRWFLTPALAAIIALIVDRYIR